MAHTTKSGVDSRLVRRLQRALGIKYAQALRLLESMDGSKREAFVDSAEEGV